MSTLSLFNPVPSSSSSSSPSFPPVPSYPYPSPTPFNSASPPANPNHFEWPDFYFRQDPSNDHDNPEQPFVLDPLFIDLQASSPNSNHHRKRDHERGDRVLDEVGVQGEGEAENESNREVEESSNDDGSQRDSWLRAMAIVEPSSSSSQSDSDSNSNHKRLHPYQLGGVASQPGSNSNKASRRTGWMDRLFGSDAERDLAPAGDDRREAGERRWEGWDTTTVYLTETQTQWESGSGGDSDGGGGPVTVTTTLGAPTPTGSGVQTVTATTYPSGVTPPPSPSGVTTVTLTETFSGCSDFENGGDQCTVTQTQTNEGLTTYTATTTRGGGGGGPASQTIAAHRSCAPGDSGEKDGSGISPTHTQQVTLYVIAIYLVGILVGWNLFIVRHIIYPIKLLVVAYHEFGHVVFAALAGARIESVSIDPNEGGATQLEGGVWPLAALPAGYISSILIGGALTFCGFDTLASKVASGIIGMTFVVVFWWASGLITRILTLGALGLMIGLWFIDHASALRYFILFIGVMSSFYVIWDVMDDFVFRKVNPSCPVQFATRIPRFNPGVFGAIWLAISTVFFIVWVLAALATWRQTPHAMFCQSQSFLPT